MRGARYAPDRDHHLWAVPTERAEALATPEPQEAVPGWQPPLHLAVVALRTANHDHALGAATAGRLIETEVADEAD